VAENEERERPMTLNPLVIQREFFDARLRSLYSSLPSFALSAFIVGVSLTHILESRWPNAWRLMLLVAVSAAFVNALVSYLQLRRSRAKYREELESLRAIDPELATKLQGRFPL
jgi:hypothetical protein